MTPLPVAVKGAPPGSVVEVVRNPRTAALEVWLVWRRDGASILLGAVGDLVQLSPTFVVDVDWAAVRAKHPELWPSSALKAGQ